MTIQDPFAAPADEPQASVEEKPAVATAYVDVKPRFSEDFPFGGEHVVTLKGGSGYDAPWYVIHASGLDELEGLFFGEDSTRLSKLFERIQVAAKYFAKQGGSAPAQSATPQRSSTPQAATAPPNWFPDPPAPDWVYKTGFKNGKVWHAWAPAQKGGGDWQFHRAP